MSKRLLLVLFVVVIAFLAAPECFALERTYSRKTNSEMKIALTFDDGPHPKGTPPILAVLDKYGIPATFFVIGENAERYPDLLVRIKEGGHEIGNHTYNHINVGRATQKQIIDQILKTENLIYSIAKYRPRLFRPPEGSYNAKLRAIADELDYFLILWAVDTRDWTGLDAGKIVTKTLSTVKSGDMILMHDYVKGGGHTAEALEALIPELIRQGYRFVTVSELIASK